MFCSEYCEIFKNTYFEVNLLTAAPFNLSQGNINWSKAISLSSVWGELLITPKQFLYNLCVESFNSLNPEIFCFAIMLTIMFRLLYVTLTQSKSNKRFSMCVLSNTFPKTFLRVAGNSARSYCYCLHSIVMLHINDYLQREIFIFWLQKCIFPVTFLVASNLMQVRNVFNFTPIIIAFLCNISNKHVSYWWW